MKCQGVTFKSRIVSTLGSSSAEKLARLLGNISLEMTIDEKGSTLHNDLGSLVRDLYLSNQELRCKINELEQRTLPLANVNRTASSMLFATPYGPPVAENRSWLTGHSVGYKVGHESGFKAGFEACKKAVAGLMNVEKL